MATIIHNNPYSITDGYLKQLGDDVKTVFNYDFYISKESDLKVYLDHVLGFPTEVTGVGNQAGGTFELSVAPASMVKVVAMKGLPVSSVFNMLFNGDLTAALLNEEFNYMRELLVQADAKANTAIRFKESVDLTASILTLGQPEPNSILKTDDTGKFIAFVPDNSSESDMQAEVDKAEGFAQASEASATLSSDSALAASNYENSAEDYATYPVNSFVPNTTDYSAKHYAQKALDALNQTFQSGGVHDSTVSQYPDVAGIVVDTIWVMKEAHTFTSGDLNGFLAVAGDQLFYDTPNNIFILINLSGGSVQSVNGNTSSVIVLTANDVGAVPTNRTVNGKSLSSNISISLSELGYSGHLQANKYVHPSIATLSINTTGAEVVDTVTTNNEGHVTALTKRTMTLADIGAASSVHGHTAASVGAEPTLNADQKLKTTYGTSAPSGGSDGDIYIQYT